MVVLSVRSLQHFKSGQFRHGLRTIYSQTGVFEPYLTEDKNIKIEEHWKPKLLTSLPKNEGGEKYYVLSMFPYPSGKLHMGHVRVYSLSDSFAHYYRMRGYNVIHPMGWDAFGLPAENAAIENNVNPKLWTEQNILRMKDQLSDLGCVFDWDREIATCDPSYYRWTQHLFLEMYKDGLVYQTDSIVNWDPVDHTVLADEQVDEKGCSWRSGAKVEKKPLKQWFFRTTRFCEQLLDGLKDPILFNWRDIIRAQENWIGKANGTKIEWKVEIVKDSKVISTDSLSLWTETPEFIYATSFIGVHPDHILAAKYPDALPSDGGEALCQLVAINPLSGERVPVISSSYLDYDYGSQTVHGVPGEVGGKQLELAKQYNISYPDVISKTNDGDDGVLQNCGPLDGLTQAEAKTSVMQLLQRKGVGGYLTSSNLQDWLISRQRYWGTPIPIVHCESCGAQPVPDSQLPVELPHMDGLSVKGMSPLLAAHDWISTNCPKCGGAARRETDTMDTFVDSSWYFLRYLDPKNEKEPFSQEAAKNMPVDLYIGGKEHAYLHLYFARFFTHYLHSKGLLPVREPFSGLITQGMVKGKSYRVKGTTKFIRPDEASQQEGGKFVEAASGLPLVVEWEKMSKSKHNGVDPSELIAKYGCDTVRLMMLSNVGPATERNWSEDMYPGVRNMQIKLWKLVHQAITLPKETLPELRYDDELKDYREKLREARNNNLKVANYNYYFTRNLAVVIARVHSMLGAIWSVPGQVKRDAPEYQQLLGTILILLAPIAPHFTSELWAGFQSVPVKLCDDFNWDKGIFHQPWPQVDPTYNLDMKIFSNKKEIASVPVVRWKFDTLSQEEAFDLACHVPEVQEIVLPHDIIDQTLIKHEGFEAQLYLEHTGQAMKQSDETDEERKMRFKEEREAKKRERAAKKAARAERIAKMAEAEQRKAAKVVDQNKSQEELNKPL